MLFENCSDLSTLKKITRTIYSIVKGQNNFQLVITDQIHTLEVLSTVYKVHSKLKLRFLFFLVFCSLPLPWFLFTLVFQKPVPVSAEGMVCSIVLLFMMLVMVFLSILIFNWKMTKFMGFSMFVFYFIFVVITLGFEYDFWACPI